MCEAKRKVIGAIAVGEEQSRKSSVGKGIGVVGKEKGTGGLEWGCRFVDGKIQATLP